MTIKTAFIGATTAIAIAAASIAVPTTASASPFASFKTTSVETQAAGIEEVKRRRYYRGRRVNPGAAAAVGVGALIVGAAIAASAANARTRCRVVRVERWSPRYRAYVIRKERVCN